MIEVGEGFADPSRDFRFRFLSSQGCRGLRDLFVNADCLFGDPVKRKMLDVLIFIILILIILHSATHNSVLSLLRFCVQCGSCATTTQWHRWMKCFWVCNICFHRLKRGAQFRPFLYLGIIILILMSCLQTLQTQTSKWS